MAPATTNASNATAAAAATEPLCATTRPSTYWFRVRTLFLNSSMPDDNSHTNPHHSSNNPFAPSTSPSFGSPSPQPKPPQPSFNLGGTYDSHSPTNLSALTNPSPSVSPQPAGGGGVGAGTANRPVNVKTKKELGANEAHLASLFANRDDGQDTFGNVGALRCVFDLFFLVWLWVV